MPKRNCIDCGVELTEQNWEPSKRKSRNYICRECRRVRERKYQPTVNKYQNNYVKGKTAGYGGVCKCPKCGRKGYKYYRYDFNIKTKVAYGVYTVVTHKHTEKGKTVYETPINCYIGMGRL